MKKEKRKIFREVSLQRKIFNLIFFFKSTRWNVGFSAAERRNREGEGGCGARGAAGPAPRPPRGAWVRGSRGGAARSPLTSALPAPCGWAGWREGRSLHPAPNSRWAFFVFLLCFGVFFNVFFCVCVCVFYCRARWLPAKRGGAGGVGGDGVWLPGRSRSHPARVPEIIPVPFPDGQSSARVRLKEGGLDRETR